jgi:hypothetical protein
MPYLLGELTLPGSPCLALVLLWHSKSSASLILFVKFDASSLAVLTQLLLSL